MTTSWSRTSVRTDGTANAELPKNTVRTRRVGRSDVAKRLFFFLFGYLDGDRLAEVGRLVEDEHAVEMGDFALEAAREPSLRAQIELVAVAIQACRRARLGALDVADDAGHRQAAFDAFHFAFEIAEHGVDDGVGRLVLGEMHHDDALAHADLRRGEPDARRVAHRG